MTDVVSKNPDDYTIKKIVNAENEIDAIKKVAISMIKEEHSIEWIKNIQGNLKEVIAEFMQYNYSFTDVCLLS